MTPDERTSVLAPFAIFAVVALALYFIVRLPDAATTENQALLRDPLYALHREAGLPAGAKQAGECNYVLKGSFRAYSCGYAMAGTRKDIEERFDERLRLHGWHSPTRTPHEVWWCQGDFVAVVSPLGSAGRYSFSIQTALSDRPRCSPL